MRKAIFTVFVAGTAALAQETAPSPQVHMQVFERRVEGPSGNVMFQAGAPMGAIHQMAVEYIGAESGLPGEVVKGKPYSAESVTESTQVLGDGNRIRNRNTAQIYRDAEGRTRREPSLPALGLAPGAELPQLVFINDPVAGLHYVLNVKERTAQKMKIGAPPQHLAELKTKMEMGHVEMAPAGGRGVAVAGIAAGPPMPHEGAVHTMTYSHAASMQGGKTESLGRQTIEGVEADGTRTTWTIAAGEIGNDRPIDIVDERWYSQELQAVVMSRHSDPRMGETVFRLSNLSRTDPPRSLFEPPADYKVSEGQGDVIRRRIAAPPIQK